MTNAARPLTGKSADKPASKRVKAAAGERAGRASLTPETWIEAATEVLVDSGIDHVKVDVLSGDLQVTRGSFYWHFRDREDLLRRLLQAWSERATEQLTRRLEGASRSPKAQLHDVISLPFRGGAAVRAARIELAIRAWARRDPMARAAVDKADASRIAYHESVFRALGFSEAEARTRGFLLYSYEVAESLLLRQGGAAAKRERSAFVEQLVLQPLVYLDLQKERYENIHYQYILFPNLQDFQKVLVEQCAP